MEGAARGGVDDAQVSKSLQGACTMLPRWIHASNRHPSTSAIAFAVGVNAGA
jgi:hypothetical protein